MEQISDITECCICLEIYTDPRVLPCIHTFCLKCLEATRSKSDVNPGDTMPCPICRQQFTITPDGLSGLQKNFFMERLMEIAKISKPLKTKVSCDVCLVNKDDADVEVPGASKYCVECRENMCEICSVQHKRQKFSRDHHIVPFGDQLKDELVKTIVATYCSQHNKEELKMYCADCKKVICMTCIAESHQMHKCSDVTKVADSFRDEIDVFLAKVVEGSKEALAQELQLEQNERKFMEELEIAEIAINERANELRQLIDKHAKVLLDELIQRKTTRMKETEIKSEEIKRYLATANSFNAYCSEIKSKGTPSDICRSVHDLRARANELQEVNALQIKQDTSIVQVSFKTSALEDILQMADIFGSLKGDERDNPSADGDEWLLQPGESRRVYGHRRHPDDWCHDPDRASGRKKRHPRETETPVLHHQPHHPFLGQQGLRNQRMPMPRSRTCQVIIQANPPQYPTELHLSGTIHKNR